MAIYNCRILWETIRQRAAFDQRNLLEFADVIVYSDQDHPRCPSRDQDIVNQIDMKNTYRTVKK